MLGREGRLVVVNGQLEPRITSRAGRRERWRIVNACTARFLSLRLDGHRLHLLGKDGGRFARPVATDEVLLAPATGPTCWSLSAQVAGCCARRPMTGAAWG